MAAARHGHHASDAQPDVAPRDHGCELMAKRETVDMQPEVIPSISEVLRGQHAEWLRGRLWPGGPKSRAGRNPNASPTERSPHDNEDDVVSRSTSVSARAQPERSITQLMR